jgi:hypothetical protein
LSFLALATDHDLNEQGDIKAYEKIEFDELEGHV